jgi:hypothetical protein
LGAFLLVAQVNADEPIEGLQRKALFQGFVASSFSHWVLPCGCFEQNLVTFPCFQKLRLTRPCHSNKNGIDALSLPCSGTQNACVQACFGNEFFVFCDIGEALTAICLSGARSFCWTFKRTSGLMNYPIFSIWLHTDAGRLHYLGMPP